MTFTYNVEIKKNQQNETECCGLTLKLELKSENVGSVYLGC